MTTPHTKRIDFVVTPKLQELGFTKAYTVGKDLVLVLSDNSHMLCKFDPDSPVKTTETYLKRSLIKLKSKFTNDDKESIITEVCNILFEELKQRHEHEQKKSKQSEEVGENGFIDSVDEYIQKYNLKTVNTSKHIYYWSPDDGVYLPNGHILIQKELETGYLNDLKDFNADGVGFPPEPWTRKNIDEFIGHIERRTYIDITDLNKNKSWIACKDCIINLVTGETAPFNPEYLNTTQIPVKYNVARNPVIDFWQYWVKDPIVDSSLCPHVMKFLHEIISKEDVELLLDFMAYCLWRYHKYHLWMLFNGGGQNGKSTLLTLIGIFFGNGNVAGESLERLLTDRFAPANLYQKLVNVDADISGDILLRNVGKLKKLTGNDEFPAEFKYGQPFKFRNYAKLIFSCNAIPECDDKSDAFFRRLIIINFLRQFLGDKEDPNLIDKLTTEEELSGLLCELLRRLPRVLQKGVRPTTNEAMKETHEKYEMASNPIEVFIEKAIAPGNEVVPKSQMYESYCWFCREKGLPVESEQSFSRKLSQDHGLKSKQLRVNGTKAYCWYDLKIVNWKALEDKEQETLEDIGEFTQAQKEAMI